MLQHIYMLIFFQQNKSRESVFFEENCNEKNVTFFSAILCSGPESSGVVDERVPGITVIEIHA